MSSPKYSRLDPAQRREQILDAANALFAERPYDEVSIEDIASAAGVTRGLVHHYFGGRKEVYIGLLERLGAQREDDLRPPVGRSARARAWRIPCRGTPLLGLVRVPAQGHGYAGGGSACEQARPTRIRVGYWPGVPGGADLPASRV